MTRPTKLPAMSIPCAHAAADQAVGYAIDHLRKALDGGFPPFDPALRTFRTDPVSRAQVELAYQALTRAAAALDSLDPAHLITVEVEHEMAHREEDDKNPA